MSSEHTRTDLVNRLVIVMATGFSTVAYALDVLVEGGVGLVTFAPLAVALAIVAYDAHRASQTDDLPEGVVVSDGE